MDKLTITLFNLPRRYKRIISLCIDTLFILFSFWSAYFVRLADYSVLSGTDHWLVAAVVLPLTLMLFITSGLYRAVLRYLSVHALLVIFLCCIGSAVLMTVVAFYVDAFLPRTVPIIYATFLCVFVVGSRMSIKGMVNRRTSRTQEPVIIYGAGGSGRQLRNALEHSHEYTAVAFVDDDKSLHGQIIHGIEVYGAAEIPCLISKYDSKRVLLALPRASRKRRKQIIQALVPLPVEVLTVPPMPDIVSGKAKIDELHDVSIDDLLGRESVPPREALMFADIKGKSVMVTGAGGSIGSELCRQILRQSPARLVLFELSEFGLYSIEKELHQIKEEEGIEVQVIPILGSVQRKDRIAKTMRAFGVQTVYHAAAYKHVPLVEYNVVEGVRNNIFGTMFCAQAAEETGVETFVLISTDKAVRPTNVMGTTKRMAELVLQALAARDNGTRFCMVRFGNVLGSSGSVIPLFKKQIAAGGPVTVTHPEIIRYFMTIPEAAQLVIQAGAMGMGGDVFVLEMGEPVRIIDLATNLIQLSGLQVKDEANPDGDIEIQLTGLRPGEKLYEELLIGENVSGTSHERIMAAEEHYLSWELLKVRLFMVDYACENFDHKTIRNLLLEAPTGFNPTDEISDLVWCASQNQDDEELETYPIKHGEDDKQQPKGGELAESVV